MKGNFGTADQTCSVVDTAFNHKLESLLLLLGELVLVNELELRPKVSIGANTLEQRLELGNRSLVQVLLFSDFGQNDNHLLESLVLLSKNCNRVNLKEVSQKLILYLSFIDVVLDGKESEPVRDKRIRIDNLVLEFNDFSKGRNSIVLGVHELLDLRFFVLNTARHLIFNGCLQSKETVVADFGKVRASFFSHDANTIRSSLSHSSCR